MAFFLIMYIEIAKDILDDALEKSGYGINTSRDFLIAMALCVIQGKHYVVVPALRNNDNLKKKLVELLGKTYVAMLDYNNRKYSDSIVLRQKNIIRAVITNSEKTNLHLGAITVNLVAARDFEPWTETFVLTENLSDSKFYELTARYYMRKENISSCKMSYYPLMGGGGTIAQVLEHEIKIARHFCLAIADSDKKYPEASIGGTAKEMLSKLTANPFNIGAYVLEKVMEVENLLPQRLVVEYGDKAGYIEIFNKDPSFFDMKKGLALTDLYDRKVCEYWRNQLPEESSRFKERDQKIQNCNKEEDYIKKVRDSKCIKKGFGNKLLVNMLSAEEDHRSSLLLTLYGVCDKDLNNFQQDEWYNVGKIMFSWTCARNRVSAQL